MWASSTPRCQDAPANDGRHNHHIDIITTTPACSRVNCFKYCLHWRFAPALLFIICFAVAANWMTLLLTSFQAFFQKSTIFIVIYVWVIRYVCRVPIRTTPVWSDRCTCQLIVRVGDLCIKGALMPFT